MRMLLSCVAAATLVAVAVPVSASAAVRTGSVQDPAGDAPSLNGPILDLRSVAVVYDDAAGTLRVTWAYYNDVLSVLDGDQRRLGGFTGDAPARPGVTGDGVSVGWSGSATGGGSSSLTTDLRIYGVAGSLTGSGEMGADGQSVTAEFTNPSLVGHEWQRGSTISSGDEAAQFWFDGYGQPVSFPPPPAGTTAPPSTPPPSGGNAPDGTEPAPGTTDGRSGMTINNGAQFTNYPAVTLSVIAPSWARSLRVANDGGFLKARGFALAPTVEWNLEESGSERLPKTVYLRFGRQAQTFTDDIILDQTKPTLVSASLFRTATARAAMATPIAAKKRTYRVRLRARDTTSGVAKVQFAANKRRPSKLRGFSRVASLRAVAAPRFVRVRDRAGNYSRWRSIR